MTKRIIRAARDSTAPYFSLSRQTAQDSRLSFEARGLLAYLLSKPDDWQVDIDDLKREGRCGRDRIYRILRELTSAGYIRRECTRSEKGTIVWGDYLVYERPLSENPHDEVRPFPEKPDTDNQKAPLPENPDTEKPEMVEPKDSSPNQPFPENPYTEKPYTDYPYTEKPYPENTDAYIIQNIQNRDSTESSTANAVDGSAPNTGPDGPVAAPAQPPSPPAIASEPVTKPLTPRQALFGAICEAFGYDSKTLTRESRGAINHTVKSLLDVGATPEDIPALHAYCTARFTEFGPAALAKWWPEFVKKRKETPEPAPGEQPERIEIYVDTSAYELPRLLERAERKRQELIRAQQAIEEAMRR